MAPNTSDYLGRFYVTDGTGRKFTSYYQTLKRLSPLFYSTEWNAQTTGFYLNADGEKNDVVRISYFCGPNADPRNLVRRYLASRGLAISMEAKAPTTEEVSRHYGGEEARFRSFLSTYSLVGLELVQQDLHYAQCLFVVYRLQVFLKAGDCRRHFAPSFLLRSPYYRSLPEASQKQFLVDLAHWPNPPEVDWAHFFVNMILGCDFNNVFSCFEQISPLSRAEINHHLLNAAHVFQVPEDWKTDGS